MALSFFVTPLPPRGVRLHSFRLRQLSPSPPLCKGHWQCLSTAFVTSLCSSICEDTKLKPIKKANCNRDKGGALRTGSDAKPSQMAKTCYERVCESFRGAYCFVCQES